MPTNPNAFLDINKTPQELIIEQINVENNTSLVDTDFIFSAPSVASLPFSSINTKVTLTPKVTSGYVGTQDIYYSRMDIVPILDNPNVEILITNEVNLSDLIGQINTKYGIRLTADDYIDAVLPVPNPATPDAILTVPVQIKSTSYLFVGNAALVLGPKVRPLDETGIAREYYFVTSAPASDPVYQNKLLALDTVFLPSQTFTPFRNALNITKFRVDSLMTLSNGDIHLGGDFGFDCALGTSPLQTYDADSVILSINGNIKNISSISLFGPESNKRFKNKNVDKVYVIDQTNTLGTVTNKLYRFNNDGTMDSTYIPTGISYVPETIAIDDAGKVYTASPQYLAPLPWDTNTQGKQIRIDRLLVDGSLDATFSPIYITSTGVADVTPVAQILPVQSLGAWIYLLPVHSVASNGTIPLVNNVPFVLPTDPQDCSFQPIFRCVNDGSILSTFKSLLPDNAPDTVFVQAGANMNVNDSILYGTNNRVGMFTNKLNAVTGFIGKHPMSFESSGAVINISPERAYTDVRWSNAKSLIRQSNNKFVVYGMGQTKLPGGGWSTPTAIAALYSDQSQLIKIFYSPTVAGVTTPQIYNLDIVERAV